MTTSAYARPLPGVGRFGARFPDQLLIGLTIAASAAVVGLFVLLIVQVITGSSSSISTFGIGFLWHSTWNPTLSVGVPNGNVFGAAALIYGTAVTSFIALVIAVPLGVAIGVFLSMLSPGRWGAVIGPLVELLAAVPSVIFGLWGIIVLAPFLRSTIEPALHAVLGWIPIFGAPSTTGLGVFTAGVILALMILPIVASICRDLFRGVAPELKDAALALGVTRWEMIRGVVLDSTRAGIGAATILGLSRALGEAIAVTQVIGTGTTISRSLFDNGDTLASRIAEQFIGATSNLQKASLFYLALVLLVMGLLANLAAKAIVRHAERRQGLAR